MAKSGDAYAATTERVARARELLAAKAFVATEQSVYVYSDRPGVPGYSVTPGDGCSCPDAQFGEARRLLNGMCKHRMLVELLAAQRREPRRLAPREDAQWLDEQDELARRRRAAARLEEIEREFA